MDIQEYAKTRDLKIQTALKLLERDEISGKIASHIEAKTVDGEETIILDDTAVEILDEYIVFRPETSRRSYNYRSESSTDNEKPTLADKFREMNMQTKKKILIGALVVLFVYYMVSFFLNIFGVITKGTLALMIIPVALVVIIMYFIVKKKMQKPT